MLTTFATSIDSSILLARRTLYRTGALIFADPASGEWQTLLDSDMQRAVHAAAELLREESAAPEELARGEHPASELDATAVFEALPQIQDDMNLQYEQAFGLLATSPNPPYETEYIGPKQTFQRSQHLADVAGFYQAFGLQTWRERPDHVALELEFMACLIGLEHDALSAPHESLPPEEREQRAAVCRDAQRRFVREHLVWWFPTLARLLELEASDTAYAAAGRLLCALLPLERTRFGIAAVEPSDGPTPIEQPDACSGCLLQPEL